MRKEKTKRLLISFLVVALFGFVSCTENNTETIEEVETIGETETSTEAPSVAVLVENTNDKALFESATNGAKMCHEQYGSEVKVIVYGDDESKVLTTVEDISNGPWDIIVLIGRNNLKNVETLADKYPQQKYVLLGQQVSASFPNVYSCNYKNDEGAYLAGALAAMVTIAPEEMPNANEDKIIGFLGSMDITATNEYIVGFIQGAKSVDPDIKVITSYINSFTDTEKGKELATVMYEQGADVIFNGADEAGFEAFEACKEANKYIIGNDADYSAIFADDEEKGKLILTSQIKNIDKNIVDIVGRYLNGDQVFGENETLGVASGVIALTDNEYYQRNVPEVFRDRIAEYFQQITNGTITIKSAKDMDEADIQAVIDSAQP